MNKNDILRAARGHALEKHYFYLIEVNNGSPVLLEKRPRSGKDIVLNIVLTKQDDEFTTRPCMMLFLRSASVPPVVVWRSQGRPMASLKKTCKIEN